MEVDPTSSKFRQQTNFRNEFKTVPMNVDPSTSKFNQTKYIHNFKRNANSGRFTGQKLQRINHMQETKTESNCNEIAERAQKQFEEEPIDADQVNFLRGSPIYRS